MVLSEFRWPAIQPAPVVRRKECPRWRCAGNVRAGIAVVGQAAAVPGSFAAGNGRVVQSQSQQRISLEFLRVFAIRTRLRNGRPARNEFRLAQRRDFHRITPQTRRGGANHTGSGVIGTEFHRRLPIADRNVGIRREGDAAAGGCGAGVAGVTFDSYVLPATTPMTPANLSWRVSRNLLSLS